MVSATPAGAGRGPSPAVITIVLDASGDPAPVTVTLRSLARQGGVSCEVLVTCDGDAASQVRDALDRLPSSRIVHAPARAGLVERVNAAASSASASVVTILAAGDELLPGALASLVATMAAPDVVMAHAFWFGVDSSGRIPQRALRRRREILLERFPPGMNHRKAMVVQGNVIQALPTFLRDTLIREGGLRGRSLDHALYTASIRVMRHGRISLVPDFLCCRGPATGRHVARRGPAKALALAHGMALLWRRETAHLWNARGFLRLAVTGVVDSVLGTYPLGWRRKLKRLRRHWGERLRTTPGWRSLVRLQSPYAMLSSALQWWTPRPGPTRPSTGSPRVGYVLARYPLRSDTFIRREILAVRDAGIPVDLFTRDVHVATEHDTYPIGPATVIERGSARRARAFLKPAVGRTPWRVLTAWLWVVRYQGRSRKSAELDMRLLYDAANLARVLRERGVTHVHVPWADAFGAVAMLAARLAGVTFSAEGRASEIRRTAAMPFVADRTCFADYLVTNCRNNEEYLRSLRPGSAPPIHVAYEGVDLDRFDPDRPVVRAPGPWRLLTVARLVEPKGLEVLLHGVHRLRQRGAEVTCDVVGGSERSDTATWVRMRMLITSLALGDCVRVHGSLGFPDVLDAMRRADIFVLPSLVARDGSRDITPNSLMEAMAMALPVVSTTVGGIPEIVEHDTSGILVPPADVPALANAIERLAADESLRTRLGLAARRTIEQRFDLRRNVEAHARLFRSAHPE